MAGFPHLYYYGNPRVPARFLKNALEYKKEGIVLGVGAKLFSLAGPVLVSGITASMVIGFIYWIIGLF